MIRSRRNEKEIKEHEEEQRSEGDLIIFGGAYASLIHNLQICSRERQSFFFSFDNQENELFLIDNTNTKRPLMKEQIVDCGEETQKTDVGYSRTKTKVETEGSQKNKKEKD